MKRTLLFGVMSLIMGVASAQVDCNIANMQGSYAGGYLAWELGQEALYVLVDPADDYGIAQSCGATYPYTIETIDFALADASAFGAGDGIGTITYAIKIYGLNGGDACNGPGAELGTSGTITTTLTGAGISAQTATINVEVTDAFFVSYEPISWSGPAGQVPSLLWDAVARPLCVQQLTMDGGATFMDFTDFFTDGETGWADLTVFGTSSTSTGGECEAGTLVDTTPASICPAESVTFDTGGTHTVPAGNTYAIYFEPTTGTGGLDGAFYLTGITLPYEVDNDLDGTLSGNGFPVFEGEWNLYSTVVTDADDPANTVCAESVEFLAVTFLDASDPACESTGGEPCVDWVAPDATGGWTDFNDLGGAPCDDGTGCPFVEIDAYEINASEAYQMINVQEGGSYTFSHCNGPNAGSWIPEYTIIAPSGAVDAFGEGDGDGCSITWTATESGIYLVVINEAGMCGSDANVDGNGHPAITCNGNAICDPNSDVCDAGTIEDTTPVSICPTESTTFSTGGTHVVPTGNAYAIYFEPTTGTGALGGAFYFTGMTLPYEVDNDLDGTLSGNGFPVFEGEWNLYSTVVTDVDDPANTVCAESVEFKTVTFLSAGDPACESTGDEPCTDWVSPDATSGWEDFDELGGAPCDDGSGCPFVEIDVFEVYQSEAYQMINVQAGGSYTFSHCNGPNAGSWIPEYTIIAPSGAVDAYGAGDGDGCSISWTATESGTYLVVLNEVGMCGTEGSDPNGYPAITCDDGTVVCPAAPANDDCADAMAITPDTYDFDNSFATTDGPEHPGSDCDGAGEAGLSNDLWYTYTASCDGAAIMTTCGTTTLDTRLAVYAGGACPTDGSALIACNDDGFDGDGNACSDFTSVLEWDIVEGETYLLRLGGYSSASIGSGTFELIEDCFTSIDENNAHFAVFPNPNNGQFVIDYAGDAGKAQIQVLDVSGKTVYDAERSLTNGSRLDIDLGNVNGMYFVRLTMDQNTTVLKVIVQ